MKIARKTRNKPLPLTAAPAPADPVEAMRVMEEELAALRREQKELHQAIFEAAQVQRKLCSPRELRRGPFEIAAEMFPVRHLSGDFYKVFDLGSRIGLAIGDIAGKGLSAGLWLAHLIGLLHICAREHSEPSAAMAAINRELSEGEDAPPLTALFLGCLNLQTSELEYCNAGQPAALLLRRGGSVDSLHTGGPMLGAVREAKFEAGRVTLEPGDTLVAFTDGVVECSNAKDEEFGTKRLTAAAGATGGADAKCSLFSTLGAALDFAGGRPPADDLTLLVVRRRAEALAELAASPAAVDFSALRSAPLPGVRLGGRAARSGIGFDR